MLRSHMPALKIAAAVLATVLCVLACDTKAAVSPLDKERQAEARRAGGKFLLFPSEAAERAFMSLPALVTFVDRDGIFGGAKGEEHVYKRIHDYGTILGHTLTYMHWIQSPDGDRVWYIYGPRFDPGRVPISSDGDAADLYRRITGKAHPTLKGELSAGYRAFLERRGW